MRHTDRKSSPGTGAGMCQYANEMKHVAFPESLMLAMCVSLNFVLLQYFLCNFIPLTNIYLLLYYLITRAVTNKYFHY